MAREPPSSAGRRDFPGRPEPPPGPRRKRRPPSPARGQAGGGGGRERPLGAGRAGTRRNRGPAGGVGPAPLPRGPSPRPRGAPPLRPPSPVVELVLGARQRVHHEVDRGHVPRRCPPRRRREAGGRGPGTQWGRRGRGLSASVPPPGWFGAARRSLGLSAAAALRARGGAERPQRRRSELGPRRAHARAAILASSGPFSLPPPPPSVRRDGEGAGLDRRARRRACKPRADWRARLPPLPLSAPPIGPVRRSRGGPR